MHNFRHESKWKKVIPGGGLQKPCLIFGPKISKLADFLAEYSTSPDMSHGYRSDS